MSDLANLAPKITRLRAITPVAFFDDAFTYDWTDSKSGLPPTDQLYTARGSQGLSVNNKNAEYMISDLDDYE